MNPESQSKDQPGALPAISVVTCSYNQGKFLEETITSVLGQGYPRLQYIVIDGGSKDNSVDIIKKYAGKLDYWISEKDRGQSHAVNKGLARCTGEIFSWINSDDVMSPGTLQAVAEAWMKKPGTIIAGGAEIFNEDGIVEIIKARGITLKNFIRFWEASDFGWCQPSTFVPLNVFREVGFLREDLHHAMDYVMLIQLMSRGIEISYVDRILTRFRLHAESKTVGSKAEQSMERIAALRSLKDLPVKVDDSEWDAEIARRQIELARREWKAGKPGATLKLLGRAFATSPKGTIQGVSNRLGNLAKRGA